MEKVKLQQKTYLWNLLLVVLGGVLTIAGGIANTERLSRLESKKQEYNRFHQIYYFLEEFRLNRDNPTNLAQIKIVSSILGDKEFGKEIYYYALSELRKLGKTNRNEDELINKNKIITEEDLIKALKHKLNPKL